MTYPDNPAGLTSVGFFTNDDRQSSDARERLAAIGNQWFNECKSQRQRQERQWYLNLAFYYGNQHVQFRQTQTGGSFDLYVPDAPKWRVRIVINEIRRTVRKEISRLTAQKPNAFVIPSSTEDADVFAAQAGEQIWDSLWRRLTFNKTLRQAIFWQATCGNGFLKSYWDSTKVDPGYQPIMDPNEPPQEGMEGSPDAEPDQPPGDICIEVVTPFHIFVPDLFASDIEMQPYVIHAQVRNNSWIKQNFGFDPSSNSYENVDEGMQSAMGINRNDDKKNQTTILEIWVKPGYIPELPKGGMFTLVGSNIVQGFDHWPYDHGQYPFTKIDAVPTGKFYTSSVVEDLIPIQKELNRSRGQLIEAKNRMAKPQLAVEEGSVDPKKMTTEPGQVITYKTGFNPPQPIPLQGIPSYVSDEISRLYTDISDLSGQHEVSNGSTPPGVTAATAISFLQEQDESLIAGHYTSVEEAIEKVASQCLNYVKMYWDEPRTIKVVGIESTFDVQTFKGADLRDNNDIRVEAGSALPTSRAAKQAFIMDLMKMGFIPPDKGLEILEIGGLNRLYESIQIDKRQAQRENLKMRVVKQEDIVQQAQAWYSDPNNANKLDPISKMPLSPPLIVPVNTYDNHQVHIQIHNDFRKSQNFEGIDPVVKALFEEHVNQHQEALSNTMMHPLTGVDASNPNAPDPNIEEALAAQQGANAQPSDSGGGNPGPVPMPDMQGDNSGGGG